MGVYWESSPNGDYLTNSLEATNAVGNGEAAYFVTDGYGIKTWGWYSGGSNSNKTRGILGGGRTPTQVNTIQFITFSTTGNATNFGDLTSIRAFNCAGMSDAHGGLER